MLVTGLNQLTAHSADKFEKCLDKPLRECLLIVSGEILRAHLLCLSFVYHDPVKPVPTFRVLRNSPRNQ